MSEEKEKTVKIDDKMVVVYGTGKSKSFPFGAQQKVHSIHADTLIKKGAASKEKPSKAFGEKEPVK